MKIDGGECDEPNLYVDHCRDRRTNDARDADEVVRDGRLTGIISRVDVLRLLQTRAELQV